MITEQDEEAITIASQDVAYQIKLAMPYLTVRKQAADKYLETKEEHLLTLIEFHYEKLKLIFGL